MLCSLQGYAMLTASVSYQPSPYNAITISPTVFPVLCLLSPQPTHFVAGRLYLPLAFTDVAHPHNPFPLGDMTFKM